MVSKSPRCSCLPLMRMYGWYLPDLWIAIPGTRVAVISLLGLAQGPLPGALNPPHM